MYVMFNFFKGGYVQPAPIQRVVYQQPSVPRVSYRPVAPQPIAYRGRDDSGEGYGYRDEHVCLKNIIKRVYRPL